MTVAQVTAEILKREGTEFRALLEFITTQDKVYSTFTYTYGS